MTPRKCPWCRGLGTRTAPHLAPQRWTCEDCDGKGWLEVCDICGGLISVWDNGECPNGCRAGERAACVAEHRRDTEEDR